MALEVDQLPLGAYQSNCYVVRKPNVPEAVVVDPGWPGESESIRAALADATCAGILVTHGDLDHVAGVAELAEATGAPVHMPAAEREALEHPDDLLPPGMQVPIRAHVPEVPLRGDERLELAGIAFQTMRVPGHTAGHLAFAADGCVFSGDLLFAGSVGRYDRPGASWEALLPRSGRWRRRCRRRRSSTQGTARRPHSSTSSPPIHSSPSSGPRRS